MHKFHTSLRKIQKKLSHKRAVFLFSITAAFFIFALGVSFFQNGATENTFLSSELNIAESSPLGESAGLVVPASCPSDLHDDATYGLACTSAANNCGKTNSGTYQCGGVCSVSAPASCTGWITASPNPCTVKAGQSLCSSTISWGTSNTNEAWVIIDGLTFGYGTSGSNVAPWISAAPGYNAVFYLRGTNNASLGSVSVKGQCESGTYWNTSTGTCEASCPADSPYTETNASSIATYCQATGTTCGSGYTYASSLSCHSRSGSWGTYGPTCTAPNCTGCSCVAISYSCTGSVPTNATAYTGDTTGLTAAANYQYSATNTTNKCEYSCNSGYIWNGSSCVALTCGGSVPTNATAYTGDTTGLTSSASYVYSSSNTTAKCEYSCNSGYTWNPDNSTCSVKPTVTLTANPTSITSGNSSTLTWTTSNASSCWGEGGNWSGWKSNTGGSGSVAPTSSTTYQIECWNTQGVSSGKKSATVTVTNSTEPLICTGSVPANAAMYANDNTGLTSNTPYIYSSSNTSTKCEYGCNSGYTWNSSTNSCVASCSYDGTVNWNPGCSASYTGTVTSGNSVTLTNTASGYTGSNIFTCNNGTWEQGAQSCTATPYSCTGSVPSNASMYANDNTGLTGNTAYSYSATNTTNKCEYSCNSGYTYSGGACVASAPTPVTTFTGSYSTQTNQTTLSLPAGGGTVSLNWSVTNATGGSCTGYSTTGVSGWAVGGSGGKSVTGTNVPVTVSSTTRFDLDCWNSSGTAAARKQVQVNVASSAPTVTLTASPTSITSGGSSTLTWTPSGATSCWASGGWSGWVTSTDGPHSQTVSPTSTTTYTIECWNAAGTSSGQRSATVTVSAGATCGPYSDVTVTGSTSGAVWGSSPYTDDSAIAAAAVHAGLITAGQTATIRRTSAGTLSNFPGSTRNGVTTSTWSSSWCGITLSLVSSAPTVTLTASPTSITSGGSSTLTWTPSGATSCTATGGWTGAKATTGGNQIVSPTSTTTYTIECWNAAGTSSGQRSATVTVSAAASPVLTVCPINGRSINVGSTSSLAAWYNPSGTAICASPATNVTGSSTWSTSNASRVTVNSSGTITGVSAGTANITAVYGSLSDSAPVSVVALCTSGCTNAQGITVCEGDTYTARDSCGNLQTCNGRRLCDYNWKEVAPEN